MSDLKPNYIRSKGKTIQTNRNKNTNNKSNNDMNKRVNKTEPKTNGNQKKNRNVMLIDLISDESSDTEVDQQIEDLTPQDYRPNRAVAEPDPGMAAPDPRIDSQLESEDGSDNEVIDEEEEEVEAVLALKGPKKRPKLGFKFCCSVKSDNEKPLYGVQFNTYLPKEQNCFATVGSNRVTIYECLSNGSIRLLQCFAGDKNEDYYACCWSMDDLSANPLIISGGKRGVIRIIDCILQTSRHLIGHGSDINDLKVSPHDSNLLLSSSKDHSLRLWNIKTSVCVVKFGGDCGHRDQVICADFYLLSNQFMVSTGIDHSIKIWSLDKQEVKNAIKESYDYDSEDKSFPMEWQHFPAFSSRQVHSNYVDCVQFFGKYLLSKSCDNQIVCSKPKLLDSEYDYKSNRISEEIALIDSFVLKDSHYWFIRFSMDYKQSLLSVGNNLGVTSVWDMTVEDPFEYEPIVLERQKCRTAIRQTSFSRDGTTLVCVCDDSTIWRWTITRQDLPFL